MNTYIYIFILYSVKTAVVTVSYTQPEIRPHIFNRVPLNLSAVETPF